MRMAWPGSIELGELPTLIIGIAALLLGQYIRRSAPFLRRIDIPDAVVGATIVALLCLLADLLMGLKIRFGEETRDLLLLVFFTTIGLSAKLAALRQGGRPLLILCAVTVLLLVLQNAVGIGVAMAWGAHPAYGMLGGSLSFVGGPGTALAWAKEMSAAGLRNAELVGVGSATLAVISGAIVAGPVAGWIVARHRLRSILANDAAVALVPAPADAAAPPTESGGLERMLGTVLVIALSVYLGEHINILAKQSGLLLPGFLSAMLAGVVVTNLADVFRWRLDFAPIEKGGAFALHVFLAISLMQLNLAAVGTIIVPLAANVVLQLALAIAVGYFILFRLLGRDYDAAVATGGFLGFGIASMPVAMATMDEIVRRYGPAPKGFLLITLAGSFFVDLANAFVAKGFFMLPFLAAAPHTG
jgi:ESS family glutamate:Na+ symporter